MEFHCTEQTAIRKIVSTLRVFAKHALDDNDSCNNRHSDSFHSGMRGFGYSHSLGLGLAAVFGPTAWYFLYLKGGSTLDRGQCPEKDIPLAREEK